MSIWTTFNGTLIVNMPKGCEQPLNEVFRCSTFDSNHTRANVLSGSEGTLEVYYNVLSGNKVLISIYGNLRDYNLGNPKQYEDVSKWWNWVQSKTNFQDGLLHAKCDDIEILLKTFDNDIEKDLTTNIYFDSFLGFNINSSGNIM